MLFSIHKIYDNYQMLNNPTFLQWFDYANLVSSFRGSKDLTKIRFINVYFFEYKTL